MFNIRTFQLFFMCLSIHTIYANNTKCNKDLSIDISDGETVKRNFVESNGILYDENNYFESAGKIYGCVCNLKTCIRKCCPSGQQIDNKTCQLSVHNFFDLIRQNMGKDLNEKVYHTIFGFPNCTDKRYKMPPNAVLRLLPNGHLSYIQSLDQLHYCLDYFAEFSHFSALVCMRELKNVSIQQIIGI